MSEFGKCHSCAILGVHELLSGAFAFSLPLSVLALGGGLAVRVLSSLLMRNPRFIAIWLKSPSHSDGDVFAMGISAWALKHVPSKAVRGMHRHGFALHRALCRRHRCPKWECQLTKMVRSCVTSSA